MWDLTLPGYKYIGPFNELNKGKPENWNDFVGYLHDIGYSRIEHRGGNAYIRWSKQDALAYQSWENGDEKYGGELSKAYYGIKKILYDWGLVGESEKAALRGHEDNPEPWVDPNPDKTADYKRKFEGEDDERMKKYQKLNDELYEDEWGITDKEDFDDNEDDDPVRDYGGPAEDEDVGIKEWTVDGEGKTESLTNNPPTTEATMPDGSGSGNQSGAKETGVDEVMNVSRGPPLFTFATLPYIVNARVNTVRNFGEFNYRMTSPYDVVANVVSVDAVSSGGGSVLYDAFLADASDSTVTHARWYDFYSGMYNFYHVVSCRWWATCENLSGKPFWVHQYYANDEQPPPGATNDDMLLWRDFNSHYVGAGYAAITETGDIEANEGTATTGENVETTVINTQPNLQIGDHITRRGASPIVQLSGSYTPGQHKHQVHQDDEVETWTAVNTNPKLREILGFRFKIDQNTWYQGVTPLSANDNIDFKWTFKCEYLVEFKELNLNLRYPVQRQPITVSINANPNTPTG